MQYYGTWLDFGEPIKTSILKRIIATLLGGSAQTVLIKWAYDFDQTYKTSTLTTPTQEISEYGIAQYAIDEYAPLSTVAILSCPGSGVGRALQFGFETDINGYKVSIQRIDIYTKNGRY
jgi:hypothetical protein